MDVVTTSLEALIREYNKNTIDLQYFAFYLNMKFLILIMLILL